MFQQQSHCANDVQLQIDGFGIVKTSSSKYIDDIIKRSVDISIKSERMFYSYGKAPIFIIIGGSCTGKSFVSKKVCDQLSYTDTRIKFKSFPSDKMLRDSDFTEINKKIGVKGAIVDFLPQNLTAAIKWCISNGEDFKRVVKTNLMSRFSNNEAIRIFDISMRYLTGDFELASVANVAIAYSSKGIGTFIDHIHSYSALVQLKRMLELKLFHVQIIPFFIPNSFQELVRRSVLRDMRAAEGISAPTDLRFSSRVCKEFFRNIIAFPHFSSIPLYEIAKDDFLSVIQILKEVHFPKLIEKLRIYSIGTGIILENEVDRICEESIATIKTFFGVDEKKTVYFSGGDEVLIMNADEIVDFVSKYCDL
jgi:hypothetical protein